MGKPGPQGPAFFAPATGTGHVLSGSSLAGSVGTLARPLDLQRIEVELRAGTAPP